MSTEISADARPASDRRSVENATRYVLLGASNLTLGFPLVVENLSRRETQPAEVFAAMGHGRSYGSWSRVLARELPGVLECGLWDALQSASRAATTRGLITDVGNDLLYGWSVEEILDWVRECGERLKRCGADVVLTLPPLDSVLGLSAWRYRLIRAVIFPGCRLSFDHIRNAAVELVDGLLQLGEARGYTVVATEREWYGFDPIHIRRRRRSEAWRSILSAWPGFDASDWSPTASYRLRRGVHSCRAERYRLWNRDRTASQPSLRTDRLTVSLY